MKPTADLTAREAVREIRALVNTDLYPGRRIAELALHLARLTETAQQALQSHYLRTMQDTTRSDVVLVELGRVLRHSKHRVTVDRSDIEFVYRLASR